MDLKKTAQEIFDEALKAADPYRGIVSSVKSDGDDIIIAGVRYPAEKYSRIIVIGGGKASARMGQAIEHVLGNCITDGWINTKYDHAVKLEHITVHECGHPVPDREGINGAERIIELLESADEHTLVLCLLSGGGSALLPAPAEGISLEEKQAVTSLLLSSGATINEINTVRKHLSRLKGGNMARLAKPAKLHVLILSDVIGDPLDVIASGPAVSDTSNFMDCKEICDKYTITDSLPDTVRHHILNGVQGIVSDTPKEDDPSFNNVHNTLIGNNRMSVEAALKAAQNKGFNTILLTTVIEGEAREMGTFLSSIALEIMETGNPIQMPACVVCGGETTVTIQGNGLGGRNQEMALQAAIRLCDKNDITFLSGGTDGTDGPTDAAGGVVDGNTVKIGNDKGLDSNAYLQNNDSYHYLEKTGGLLKTGPTGTNVMDVQILLIGKPHD